MRYILGFLIAIGLLILTFIILFKVFRGGPKNQPAPLINYSTTSTTMQWSINGPVSADQTHQSVQVIVGDNQSTINIIQGYQNTITSTKSYANNSDAYAVFLRALDIAGYTRGVSKQGLNDSRGYCSLGDLYTYQIVSGNGVTKQNYWGSSCGIGTSRGRISAINTLFQKQIPDYDTMTSQLIL